MKSNTTLPIRILTHNIRYAADPPSTGEQPWSDRKQLILNEFYYNTLHNAESIICLQEVLHQQLLDIMKGLGDGWSYLGVGRDDGLQAGEYNPVIYRKGVWDVEEWQTVWLNEDGTPAKKGWDAGCVRLVTMVTFKHIQSKKRLVAMCTHLDNSGTISRRESARIILKVLQSVNSTSSTSRTQNLPFFVAGDLNSEPSGEAYQILNSTESLLRDTKELAKWKYGNQYTFTDFDDKSRELIDFVFVGPRKAGDWEVEGHSVLATRFDDGIFGSDHRSVVADVVLAV